MSEEEARRRREQLNRRPSYRLIVNELQSLTEKQPKQETDAAKDRTPSANLLGNVASFHLRLLPFPRISPHQPAPARVGPLGTRQQRRARDARQPPETRSRRPLACCFTPRDAPKRVRALADVTLSSPSVVRLRATTTAGGRAMVSERAATTTLAVRRRRWSGGGRDDDGGRRRALPAWCAAFATRAATGGRPVEPVGQRTRVLAAAGARRIIGVVVAAAAVDKPARLRGFQLSRRRFALTNCGRDSSLVAG